MRTTVNLADDVAVAVDRLRRERAIGLSEALNELVRAGLTVQGAAASPFVQRSFHMGQRMSVDNIGDVLETLDGPSRP